MEIQVVSDLHLDFYESSLEDEWKDIVEPVTPYLCILGDTCEIKEIELFERFLTLISPFWEHILLLNGNHEYYGYDSKYNKKKLLEMQKKVLEKFENVHFLDNDFIEFEGVRFIGSTLWSRVPKKAIDDVEWYMNDYRSIYVGKKEVTVKETNKWHEQSVRYLYEKITESKLPVVVLTHHAPLMKGTSDPKYENSSDPDTKLTNHGFATNLESLMKPNLFFWGFGHTHWCCDFTHRNVRIYSNPRGYDTDEKYRSNQIIKLEYQKIEREEKTN